MATEIPIETVSDPRIADFVGLRQPDRRIAYESAQGVFVGEGTLVVRRVLADPALRVRSVLATPTRLADVADLLAERTVVVYVAAPALLREIVGFDLHRGIVVAADRFSLPEPDALLARHDRVLLLERVNDHENLGAMFRSAAALGIEAVLLCPECSDPLYRRSVRVSMGHVLSIPFARIASWPDVERLRAHGHVTVALTPRPDATPLADVGFSALRRVVLLAGAEGPGLRDVVIDACEVRARIPMHAGADSLNVATAVAIAAYEIARGAPPT